MYEYELQADAEFVFEKHGAYGPSSLTPGSGARSVSAGRSTFADAGPGQLSALERSLIFTDGPSPAPGIVSVASSGCHTMRPVAPLTGPTASNAFAKIEVGDLVSLELRDGTRHRFEVSQIEDEALVAESGRRYLRADMTYLEHETVDVRRTTGLVAGITVGYVILIKILESINFFGKLDVRPSRTLPPLPQSRRHQ